MSWALKICLVAGLCTACATAPSAEDAPRQPAGDAYYTLRMAPTVRHQRPLPAETDVLVDWHDAAGGTRTVTGFRGWDFTGDGRFQMVEVLGEDGATVSYVYDFDGDGFVDREVDASK